MQPLGGRAAGKDSPLIRPRRHLFPTAHGFRGARSSRPPPLPRDSSLPSALPQVALRVPPSLEGCLEFSPVTALVQAHGSVGVQLKFTVLDTLRESCAKHLVEEDTIAFPIRLTVRGQAAPVRFTLRATLTTSELLICGADGETMLHILDFGDVPVTARRQLPISLHNPSSLPQRFGFSSTEPEVLQVQPGDGLGTILPGETLQRSVLFSPSADTRFSLSLECRTSHNRKYSFRCVGRGLITPA